MSEASSVVPGSRPFPLTGARGVRLTGREWPVDGAAARVVLVHGYGEHLGRYAHVIAALNAAGYGVVGIDNRGHGESHGRRADVVTFDDFVEDIQTLVLHDETAAPGVPRIMLGHSLGGLIATRYALRHQDHLRALVLSGAALRFGGSTPALLLRLAPVVARLAPALPVVASGGPGILSRDPEVDRLFGLDPLTYKGKIRARMGMQMRLAAAGAVERLGELRLPLLVMHGADDLLTEPAGSMLVDARAASADKTLTLWPGLRHEIFNEPERDEVIAHVVAWLRARFPVSAPAGRADDPAPAERLP